MKIKYNECGKRTATTTLNDIPDGQTFIGRVYSFGDKRFIHGLFYKHRGATSHYINATGLGTKYKFDVLVLLLKCFGEPPGEGERSVWFWSREVLDYEPVDTELVVTT